MAGKPAEEPFPIYSVNGRYLLFDVDGTPPPPLVPALPVFRREKPVYIRIELPVAASASACMVSAFVSCAQG